MRNYSLRSREARSPVKVKMTSKNQSASFDDPELDSLVEFTADYMKLALSKERGAKEKTLTPWREDFVPLEQPELEGTLNLQAKKAKLKTVNIKAGREPQSLQSGFEDELDSGTENRSKAVSTPHEDLKKALQKSSQDKLLAKSVLKPDLEKQHSIPPYSKSVRSQKKERKKNRDSKAGQDWYDMRATEMTPELANDLKAIQMRSVLDPKRFYRKNDMKTLPKFVQVGKVMDSPLDFYHARLSKKDRRQTIVDELLADADTRRYNKRKYMELQIHRSKSKKRRRTLTSFL